MKFFAGAHAGRLGLTPNRYPNHDHLIVKAESTFGNLFFQLREKKGILVGDNWIEIAPTMRTEYDYDEGNREYPVYLVSGKEMPDEALVTRYDVADLTDVINGILKYQEECTRSSPYFKPVDIERFRELDEEKEEDLIIISAVEDYMKSCSSKCVD